MHKRDSDLGTWERGPAVSPALGGPSRTEGPRGLTVDVVLLCHPRTQSGAAQRQRRAGVLAYFGVKTQSFLAAEARPQELRDPAGLLLHPAQAPVPTRSPPHLTSAAPGTGSSACLLRRDPLSLPPSPRKHRLPAVSPLPHTLGLRPGLCLRGEELSTRRRNLLTPRTVLVGTPGSRSVGEAQRSARHGLWKLP